MRVDPECVYLRLEPSAHLVNHKTGKVRSVPAVELHWKDGRTWQRRTFVGSDDVSTLPAVLEQVAQYLATFPDLDAALAAQIAA